MQLCTLAGLLLVFYTPSYKISGGSGSFDLPGGTIEVSNIRVSLGDTEAGSSQVGFRLLNKTTRSWRTIDLRIDLIAFCAGMTEHLVTAIHTSLGFVEGLPPLDREGFVIIPELRGKLSTCAPVTPESVSLVNAESSDYIVDGLTGLVHDVAKEYKTSQAEQSRLAALEANRQEKIGRSAEASVRREAAKVRAACAGIYKTTSERKVSDLTVREAKLVEACSRLGLYGL